MPTIWSRMFRFASGDRTWREERERYEEKKLRIEDGIYGGFLEGLVV